MSESDPPHSSRPSLRPLVAVTASTRVTEGAERVRLNQAYIDALERAGVVPVVVPPFSEPDDVRHVLDVVSGLVLSGGEDVDPEHYGALRHPTTGQAHTERDASELELARLAHQRGLPTLAICRGVQLLNVALGGTLVQDIPSLVSGAEEHDGDAPRSARVHEIQIDPASRLGDAIGATMVRVNSIHHQALDRVADGLQVSAVATDGVIEGVEWSQPDWWALGVQWHPEELTETAEDWDRRLFAAFAEVCRRHASRGVVASTS
ncbi:MAG: gamma-glutamyl-gamma-aminobutyrate hydrolase family protein [Gemmatimonadaceae bacterium]